MVYPIGVATRKLGRAATAGGNALAHAASCRATAATASPVSTTGENDCDKRNSGTNDFEIHDTSLPKYFRIGIAPPGMLYEVVQQ